MRFVQTAILQKSPHKRYPLSFLMGTVRVALLLPAEGGDVMGDGCPPAGYTRLYFFFRPGTIRVRVRTEGSAVRSSSAGKGSPWPG